MVMGKLEVWSNGQKNYESNYDVRGEHLSNFRDLGLSIPTLRRFVVLSWGGSRFAPNVPKNSESNFRGVSMYGLIQILVIYALSIATLGSFMVWSCKGSRCIPNGTKNFESNFM